MAKKASDDGFAIKLEAIVDGWHYTWIHKPSGMTFMGICDCERLEIVLVCALQGLPVMSE